MNIKSVPIDTIKIATYNPRTIDGERLIGLKNSLQKYGQQENFIVNKDMTLISGHQRLAAAKELGWSEVFVNQVDLSKTEEKKLNILMNSSAIAGKFDDEKLGLLLQELKNDPDYLDLRLDKLEPLDLGGLNETSLGDAESPRSGDPSHVDLSGGVKQYTLVFDDDEQQERFLAFLMGLRTIYSEYDTNAARIMAFIDDNQT